MDDNHTKRKIIFGGFQILKDNFCMVCVGEKRFMGHPCTFCSGTGEWNGASESYFKDHICQCVIWGREFCPICKKRCHHDASLSPKQKIDPGFGGMTSMRPVTSTSSQLQTTSDGVTSQQIEEDMVTA